MIPLGPFELFGVMGKGGMGEVWQGRHREHRLPVAVKVLTVHTSESERFRDAFDSEARSVAALDHPGIIRVFDYGRVSEATAEASRGQLRPGDPYLVMEMADAGTVSRLRARLHWADVKQLLLRLLDALAHAHARGVVHRDLKPGNVLLSGSPTQVKLSDFGLAHPLGHVPDDREQDQIRGTPAYMSPEQVEGRWRDFGPWTDLYALGCFAWTMICGAPPFRSRDPVEVLEAQARQALPPFKPAIPVPSRVVSWVEQLLEKDPRHRYQRAADAAWSLSRLSDFCDMEPDATAHRGRRHGRSSLHLEPSPEALPLLGRSLLLRADNDTVRLDLARLVENRPPLPGDWRRTEPPRTTPALLGAGQGLFGLRRVRLVGRHNERDELWRTLRRVDRHRRPEMVLLSGPVGVGKSRLASWLSERAHELGVASTLRAWHGPDGGPAHGIGPMVARLLHTEELDRHGTFERIAGSLRHQGRADARETFALTELVMPTAHQDDEEVSRPIARIIEPALRFVLVGRLIAWLAETRSVVVWLDDLDWSTETLSFASWLLDWATEHKLRVLIAGTSAPERLAERSAERAALDELLDRGDVRRLEIRPLEHTDNVHMLADMLALDPALADRVAERSAGNPLFSAQLVGNWIERGALQLGPGGFMLRAGESAELPASLQALWLPRVERVLRRRHPQDGQVAELAAVLGQVIRPTPLRLAAATAGLTVSPGLLDALATASLLVPSLGDEGSPWAFVHGMVREALVGRARDRHRLAAHHQACADMMLAHPRWSQPDRLGRHLHAAGLLEPCLAPLLEAARAANSTSSFAEAEALIEEREAALEALALDPSDPRWGAGWNQRAWALRKRGELESAERLATRCERAGRKQRWGVELAQALVERAQLARLQGHPDRARGCLEEAVDLAWELQDTALVARVLTALGDAHAARGNLPGAEESYRAALAAMPTGSDPHTEQACWSGLGQLLYHAGRHDEARTSLDEAHARALDVDDRWAAAEVSHMLGQVARVLGELDEARRRFAESRSTRAQLGTRGAAFAEANLALCLADEGRHDEARAQLVEVLRSAEVQSYRTLAVYTHICLAGCVAALRDWAAWERHLDAGRRLLDSTLFVDADLARAAEDAGAVALAAGQTIRARDAWDIARLQWARLSRGRDVARVDALLKQVCFGGLEST